MSGISFQPLTETTVAEESLRLTRAVSGTPDRPGLSRILAQLAQDPHKTLETTELGYQGTKLAGHTRLVYLKPCPLGAICLPIAGQNGCWTREWNIPLMCTRTA